MKKRTVLFTATLMLLCNILFAQSLQQQLQKDIQSFKAIIGVSVLCIETGDTATLNNQLHYPTQSVYKFPLAMAVLHQVDEKKFDLQQKIHVAKTDLLPNTWSPLREKFPEGNVDITLAELLDYTVSKSDNNGCDMLFRLLGGTSEVEKYIHKIGYTHLAIKTTEAEMAAGINNGQEANWCIPSEMTKMLEGFYLGRHLSQSSNQFLLKLMTESENSAKRIKGLLPKSTVVAHKTGSGNKVVNDVGIITLPNGKHIALAVFVQQSKEEYSKAERIIAKLSKTVYIYYIKNN